MGGGTVADIRIEGAQRIEPETIRSYLLIQPGDAWDDELVDKSLKALFATGLFADVNLSRVGNTLVVRVVENPIINRIAFEGNSKIDEKDLNAEIQLRPRVVYTRTRVQNDVKRILDLYRRHGRFGATVEPKVIQLSENRVDLVFEINEGEFTGVRSINFVGNHEYSDSKLRGMLQTKESRWYRFLTSDDSYDPDRLTYDRELLRRFYLTEGYADFRVVSAVAELTPDRNGFIITFTLDEGERYRFGKIDVNIKIKDLPRGSGAAAADRPHRRLVRCRSGRKIDFGPDRRARQSRLCLCRSQAECHAGTGKTTPSTSHSMSRRGHKSTSSASTSSAMSARSTR